MPPGVKEKWDDCDAWTQALIIEFDRVKDFDETDLAVKLAGGK